MKVVAHLSDLHFGTEVAAVREALSSEIRNTKPDLLIVSGDLTQRATSHQFEAARAFLDGTAVPWLAVPGNHDIPLFDVMRRITAPLDRFHRYITGAVAPFWMDDEIAVLGINTVRVMNWKHGRISEQQMRFIREKFCSMPAATFKVLVTHHPLLPPPTGRREKIVGRAARMLLSVKGCGPDLAVAGHLHETYSGDTHLVYQTGAGSTLVIQAGTAVSGRLRSEPNAFNAIRIEGGEVWLTVRMWDGEQFEDHCIERFRRSNGMWHKLQG